MRVFRRRREELAPPPPVCEWSDPECGEVATVGYGCTDYEPIYCERHADEMDRVDTELGFPGAKKRA